MVADAYDSICMHSISSFLHVTGVERRIHTSSGFRRQVVGG